MNKPKTNLTAEFVRQLFHYDPETGVFTRRVTRQGLGARAGDVAGTRKPSGYLSIWICGANHMAHRLAWLYVHGVWPAGQIDHINRVRDDNRIANLRVVSHAENQQNHGVRKASTSGYKGVTWNKRHQTWVARIWFNGKAYSLGFHKTPEAGYAAYQEAAARLHTCNPAANDSHPAAAPFPCAA